MAITSNTKHNKCPVKAIKGPFGIHYAKLICKKHKKWVDWLSQADYEAIIQLDPNLIEFDGVKERPARQKPKEDNFVFQRKYGNCWTTVYSK